MFLIFFNFFLNKTDVQSWTLKTMITLKMGTEGVTAIVSSSSLITSLQLFSFD